MIKINKVFTLILIAAFLSNGSAYGISPEQKPCLRVPINRETMERLERVAAKDVDIEPDLIPTFIHECCNIEETFEASYELLKKLSAIPEGIIDQNMEAIKKILLETQELREKFKSNGTMDSEEIVDLTKKVGDIIRRGVIVTKELYDFSGRMEIQINTGNDHAAKARQLFIESTEHLYHLFLGATSSELTKDRFDLNRIFDKNTMTYEIKLADGKELKKLLSEQRHGGIELVTDLDSKVGKIYADRIKLRQVMINLIKNAAEAMPNGGILTVKTELKDNNVVISISDTGLGISRDKLAKIFEPSYSTKGTMGVGLAGSKKIIEDHGGRIEVESEVGKGTTFKVSLPIGQYDGKSVENKADIKVLEQPDKTVASGHEVKTAITILGRDEQDDSNTSAISFSINGSMQQIKLMEFEDVSELQDATALLELNEERIAGFVESLNADTAAKWHIYLLLGNVMDRAINYSKGHWHQAYIKKIEFFPILENKQDVFRITLGHLKESVAKHFLGTPYSREIPLLYDNQGRVLFSLQGIEAAGFGIMDILREMGPIDREVFLNTPCKGSTPLNQSKVSILFWIKNKNTDRIRFMIPSFIGSSIDPFYFNRMTILNEKGELTFQLRIDDFILEPLETEIRNYTIELYANSSYFEEAQRHMQRTHWGLAELAKVEAYRHHRKMPQRIAVRTALPSSHKAKLREFENIYWDRLFLGHFQNLENDIIQDILHARYYGISLEKEHADLYREELKQNIGGLISIFEDFINWRNRNPDLVKQVDERYATTLEEKLLYSPEAILQKLYEVVRQLRFSIEDVKQSGKEFVQYNRERGDESLPAVPADIAYKNKRKSLMKIRNPDISAQADALERYPYIGAETSL